MRAVTAFLDTCVLYGAVLNDTLLRLAEQGAFRPHWSDDVLDELGRNLTATAGLTAAMAKRRIDHMQQAFPDACLTGYADFVDGLTCDPKDRHVLAAAVVGSCEVLVTFNTKDFPPHSTADLITVVHPQDFLLDQLDLHPVLVVAALAAQANSYRRPAISQMQLWERLRRAGVGAFVDEVSRQMGDGLRLAESPER